MRPPPPRRTARRVTLAALLLLGAACASEEAGEAGADTGEVGETGRVEATEDGGDAGAADTDTPTEGGDEVGERPLHVLVTNDDGVEAPGLVVLVDGLERLDDVTVTVVAPSVDRSGSSDRTTVGEVDVEEVTTADGRTAYAVDGYPADAVLVALHELSVAADVVISGPNDAQNLGPFVGLSGTVGAARVAAREGVPALAVSTGVGDLADFATATDLAVAWLEEHRGTILDGEMTTETVANLNLPGCVVGTYRELVEVPIAEEAVLPEGETIFESDCTTGDDTSDDIQANASGHPTLTQVPLDIERAF